MKYETNTLPGGDSAEKVIDSQSSFTLVYKFRLTFVCSHARIQFKEQNHVSAHAKDFDFRTGCHRCENYCRAFSIPFASSSINIGFALTLLRIKD